MPVARVTFKANVPDAARFRPAVAKVGRFHRLVDKIDLTTIVRPSLVANPSARRVPSTTIKASSAASVRGVSVRVMTAAVRGEAILVGRVRVESPVTVVPTKIVESVVLTAAVVVLIQTVVRGATSVKAARACFHLRPRPACGLGSRSPLAADRGAKVVRSVRNVPVVAVGRRVNSAVANRCGASNRRVVPSRNSPARDE
jgi:hypothetical protein